MWDDLFKEAAAAVLSWDDEATTDVSLSGGKGANLAILKQAGYNVPAFFVVPSGAFLEALGDPSELVALIEAKDYEGAHNYVLTQVPTPCDLLESEYDQVMDGAKVAVRSSAVAEDSADASYAGKQETVLNVERNNLCQAVSQVWASFFTDSAIKYREQVGDPTDVRMAVVIQQMVDPHAGGVMFTQDPTGNSDDVQVKVLPGGVIAAVPGLGDAFVSGKAEADEYWVDRQGKPRMVSIVHGGLLQLPTLEQLVGLGGQLEDHFQGGQDVEWAVDKEGNVHVLQARPITA